MLPCDPLASCLPTWATCRDSTWGYFKAPPTIFPTPLHRRSLQKSAGGEIFTYIGDHPCSQFWPHILYHVSFIPAKGNWSPLVSGDIRNHRIVALQIDMISSSSLILEQLSSILIVKLVIFCNFAWPFFAKRFHYFWIDLSLQKSCYYARHKFLM